MSVFVIMNKGGEYCVHRQPGTKALSRMAGISFVEPRHADRFATKGQANKANTMRTKHGPRLRGTVVEVSDAQVAAWDVEKAQIWVDSLKAQMIETAERLVRAEARLAAAKEAAK